MQPVDHEITLAEMDALLMRRALALAENGRGAVEPNPLVGCVIARQGVVLSEGFHRRFGQPHAEVEALANTLDDLAGATMYVTLEPCCHHGKTPPCVDAILASGIRRVVVAMEDPFALVQGAGIARLRAAGIQVDVGSGGDDARSLNAPYLHRLRTTCPWIVGKWAMSLDGRIATRTGESRWISSAASRALVHQLRGCMDAIIVGSGTVAIDNPLLTARPGGPRVATRIVLASRATIPSDCQLVTTAREAPVMIVVSSAAKQEDCRRLELAGCEVVCVDGQTETARLRQLVLLLGQRDWTNVLVEGGSHVLGAFLDARLFNEVHVFIAPCLIGGAAAPGPCGAIGIEHMNAAVSFQTCEFRQVDRDFYFRGRWES